MQVLRIFFVCALLLTLGGTGPGLNIAHAGPVEELVQLATHPTDPNVMALRYEYGGDGLVVTRDGGESWGLLCTRAIDPAMTSAGPIAIAGDGTTFMGVFTGLWHDGGQSCSWSRESSFDDQWVSDVVVDPVDPTITYAITSSGAMGSMNGIYRRDGSGAWESLGTLEELLISRLHVADIDGTRRFYESALKTSVPMDGAEPTGPNYMTRYSDDGGETWTSHPFEEAADSGTYRLQGVAPGNPEHLLASVTRGDRGDDEVFVSLDAGETWSLYLTLNEFGGAIFAPDGRVFIADAGLTTMPDGPKGLWMADDLQSEPTLVTDEYPVQCLHYRDDGKLFACQRFGAGLIDLATGEYEETFRFTEIEAFVDCPGADLQGTCERQLLDAYCGITHFPFAPVCEPYGVDTSSLTGPEACEFDFDAGVGTGTSDTGECLMPSDGDGTGAMQGDGSVDAGVATGGAGNATGASGAGSDPGADMGAAAGTGGQADSGSGGRDDSGCAVARPGGGRGAGALGLLLGAIGALTVLRRRRS